MSESDGRITPSVHHESIPVGSLPFSDLVYIRDSEKFNENIKLLSQDGTA